MAKHAELPNRIDVYLIVSQDVKINVDTEDWVESVSGAFQRNGHPKITKADVKRQLWLLLNGHTVDEVVGVFLKKHVILEKQTA